MKIMTKEEKNEFIEKQHARIEDCLNRRDLSGAFTAFEVCALRYMPYGFNDKLEELKSVYQYMLQYFKEQKPDPERNSQYLELIKQAYTLNDLLTRDMVSDRWNVDYYYHDDEFGNLYRFKDYVDWLREFKDNEAALMESFEANRLYDDVMEFVTYHDRVLDEFFQEICRMPVLDEEMKRMLARCLEGEVTVKDLALIVSAVTLSCHRFFDGQKILFLLDAYKHEDPMVNQRALAGALLMMVNHNERLGVEPEILRRMGELGKDELFHEELYDVLGCIHQLDATEDIERLMNESLSHVKGRPNIAGQVNEVMVEIDDGRNLEMDNMELAHKLAELQENGYDINFYSFRHLKNVHFFSTRLSHWLMPFAVLTGDVYPMITKFNKETKKMVQALFSKQGFCESDKYSFIYVIDGMKNANALSVPIPKAAMIEDDRSLIQKKRDALRFYIQDLYRFVHLYSRRGGINFPLSKEKFRLCECPALDWLKRNYELMSRLANAFLEAEDYANALYYQKYLVTIPEVAFGDQVTLIDNYLTLAACYERVSDYDSAIKWYLEVLKFQTDNVEALRNLSQCYRRKGRFQEALGCLDQLEQMDGEDPDVLLNKALVYMHPSIDRAKDALGYLKKMEYYYPEKLSMLRAMSWCYFLLDNREQMDKYAARLLKKKALRYKDFLNLGHMAWCNGEQELAVNFYMQSAKKKGSFLSFVLAFEADREVLLRKGKSIAEIQLMKDTVSELLSASAAEKVKKNRPE